MPVRSAVRLGCGNAVRVASRARVRPTPHHRRRLRWPPRRSAGGAEVQTPRLPIPAEMVQSCIILVALTQG